MSAGVPGLRVVRSGWATTVQDRGRPGLARLGVGRAGTVDIEGAARINRALGLPTSSPVLETTGGLVLEALRPLTVLTTAWSAPSSLRLGETVRIDPAPGSNWVTATASGGLDMPTVLGSSSADTLGAIVPFAITDGVELHVGNSIHTGAPLSDLVVAPARPDRVALLPGPRLDWFVDGALAQLLSSVWTVTASSRVGVRLSGPRLERVVHRELPSEGLLAGAVQVPPDGQPIVMGPDHPVTGGYPVIAVVAEADLVTVLDRPIGSRIGFVPL